MCCCKYGLFFFIFNLIKPPPVFDDVYYLFNFQQGNNVFTNSPTVSLTIFGCILPWYGLSVGFKWMHTVTACNKFYITAKNSYMFVLYISIKVSQYYFWQNMLLEYVTATRLELISSHFSQFIHLWIFLIMQQFFDLVFQLKLSKLVNVYFQK